MSEQNKAPARRATGIRSTGDLDAADNVYDPGGPKGPHGTEEIKRFAAESREVFPDLHDSIDIPVAAAALAAPRCTFTGTHGGVLTGVEPTGKKLTWTGITIDRVVDGRIV